MECRSIASLDKRKKKSQTNVRGLSTELYILSKAVSEQVLVSVPMGDGHPYDAVFDVGGKLFRVQIKRMYYYEKLGYWTMNFRKGRGEVWRSGDARTYSKSQIDLFAFHSPETDDIYLVPVDANDRPKYEGRARAYPQYKNAWHILKEHLHQEDLQREDFQEKDPQMNLPLE